MMLFCRFSSCPRHIFASQRFGQRLEASGAFAEQYETCIYSTQVSCSPRALSCQGSAWAIYSSNEIYRVLNTRGMLVKSDTVANRRLEITDT
jgi:hypothetical protein